MEASLCALGSEDTLDFRQVRRSVACTLRTSRHLRAAPRGSDELIDADALPPSGNAPRRLCVLMEREQANGAKSISRSLSGDRDDATRTGTREGRLLWVLPGATVLLSLPVGTGAGTEPDRFFSSLRVHACMQRARACVRVLLSFSCCPFIAWRDAEDDGRHVRLEQ